jgi:methyl-accepting chemotaxis protein
MRRISLRLTLTHRIAAIGLIGVAGVIALGAIHVAGSAAQERNRLAAAGAQALAGAAAKLDNHLLDSRRSEKDFLLRNDEKYVARHAEMTKAIRLDLDAMQKHAQAAGQPQLGERIDLIRRGIDAYVGRFGAVVDAKRKLGLNENAGLEGALRKAVHEIETKLKELDDSRLAIAMLMMRRHEKDFILRRDPKYGDELNKRAGEFLAGLSAAAAPGPAKEELKQKLAATSAISRPGCSRRKPLQPS